MRLKMLAQSTVILTKADGATLLIDPGKYNLDEGRLTLDSFPVTDVLVITHKHADHYDLELIKAILMRGRPEILTNSEIQGLLATEGIPSQMFGPGDSVDVKGFVIFGVQTDHVIRGENITNFGVVITADGTSLYHTSDTRFIDPSLLPKQTRTDYLILPISNRGVVMGIDDALVFAGEIKPKLAIPVHCDSPKDKDRVNPVEFIEKASGLGLKAQKLAFGDEIEL